MATQEELARRYKAQEQEALRLRYEEQEAAAAQTPKPQESFISRALGYGKEQASALGQQYLDAASSIGHGGTLGFGDKLTAGIKTAIDSPVTGIFGQDNAIVNRILGNLDPNKTYEDYLGENREYRQGVRQRNPVGAITGEITGGLALPGGAIKQVPTIAGKLARAAGLGGLFGGTYAAGESENVLGEKGTNLDALKDIGIGAAIGSLGGVGITGAGAGISKAINTPAIQHTLEALPTNIARNFLFGGKGTSAPVRQEILKDIDQIAANQKTSRQQVLDELNKALDNVGDDGFDAPAFSTNPAMSQLVGKATNDPVTAQTIRTLGNKRQDVLTRDFANKQQEITEGIGDSGIPLRTFVEEARPTLNTSVKQGIDESKALVKSQENAAWKKVTPYVNSTNATTKSTENYMNKLNQNDLTDLGGTIANRIGAITRQAGSRKRAFPLKEIRQVNTAIGRELESAEGNRKFILGKLRSALQKDIDNAFKNAPKQVKADYRNAKRITREDRTKREDFIDPLDKRPASTALESVADSPAFTRNLDDYTKYSQTGTNPTKKNLARRIKDADGNKISLGDEIVLENRRVLDEISLAKRLAGKVTDQDIVDDAVKSGKFDVLPNVLVSGGANRQDISARIVRGLKPETTDEVLNTQTNRFGATIGDDITGNVPGVKQLQEISQQYNNVSKALNRDTYLSPGEISSVAENLATMPSGIIGAIGGRGLSAGNLQAPQYGATLMRQVAKKFNITYTAAMENALTNKQAMQSLLDELNKKGGSNAVIDAVNFIGNALQNPRGGRAIAAEFAGLNTTPNSEDR